MRALRPGTRITGALSALILCAAGAGAQGLDPYPVTLYYGTGLVTTPVAWVAPTNADIRIASTGKRLPYFVNPDAHNFATRWNTNLAVETHWLGRFTVGASLYSQNPEYGFFGRLLVLRDGDLPFLPSIAIGIRNLGEYEHEDRFKVGHDITLQDTTGGLGWEEEIPSSYRGFSTAPTFYAVATKEFQFAGATTGRGLSGLSVNVGWGNGLFQDDAGLGELYNENGTIVEGLFLGTRLTAHPTLNTTVHVVAENDAWDWNAGVVGDWRGLSLGIYATEIEEGSREETTAPTFSNVYNYTKWNVSLSYSGNIIDISRGVILRTTISELTREARRLQMEIAERERHIAALEVTLRRAQAGELADIEQRRRELEAQIQQEQDQIRRATERLQEIERQRGAPPPPPPPPTTPPSTDRSTPSL